LFEGKLAVLFIASNSYYYAELMMHVRLWGIYDTDECILGIVNASWLFNMIKIPIHLFFPSLPEFYFSTGT
jgi:hypothetical protein